MSESEKPDAKIRQASKEYSFNVVTYTIQLEEILTMIICLELSKDWMKMSPYMDYFEKMVIERKIELAKIILENNHSEVFKKFPKIFNEIKNIKELRNKLSHRNRHYTINYETKDTKFVLAHRKINKSVILSEERMLKDTKKIEKCLEDMHKLLNLFGKDFGIRSIV